MPRATTAKEMVTSLAEIAEAVGDGVLSPGEGIALGNLLESSRRVIETADLEERIERLESEGDERGKR